MQAKGWLYPDLVRESGESRSVVSQWLGRSSKLIKSIGKMQAAERLEVASGYCALWIAKGIGPKFLAGTVPMEADSGSNRTPPAPNAEASLAQALEVMGLALAVEMSSERRAELAEALSAWARYAGRARYRETVAELLAPTEARPEKRQAAA